MDRQPLTAADVRTLVRALHYAMDVLDLELGSLDRAGPQGALWTRMWEDKKKMQALLERLAISE